MHKVKRQGCVRNALEFCDNERFRDIFIRWLVVSTPYRMPSSFGSHGIINSLGDEIANVNFLRRYRTRTSKYQKREHTSCNKLDDS